jgi:ubiquinone/menaquinone biosynthesis C-methylase UbiE
MRDSEKIRNEILSEYYENVYQSIFFGAGANSKGTHYFHKQVEKFWLKRTPSKVLELGGGNGEHLPYLNYVPTQSYTSLDLRPQKIRVHLEKLPEPFLACLNFEEGDAENLPFEDATFDRVFATCLLHHVNDVLQVLLEVRRVTEIGGEIAFIFPTDPGLLNQFIKRGITNHRIKKKSNVQPQLIYALEHKNHTLGLIELIKYVFNSDELVFHYKPFSFIHSYNLNLCIVAKVVKL